MVSRTTCAAAQLVAAWVVLAGLFFMHGLATQGCAGGGASMSHMGTMATASAEPQMAALSVNGPPAHSASEVKTSTGGPGEVCVSTPPEPGWAGLLALLGIGVAGLARALVLPRRWTRPGGHRRRAPPLPGSALLMNLCVSRT